MSTNCISQHDFMHSFPNPTNVWVYNSKYIYYIDKSGRHLYGFKKLEQ